MDPAHCTFFQLQRFPEIYHQLFLFFNRPHNWSEKSQGEKAVSLANSYLKMFLWKRTVVRSLQCVFFMKTLTLKLQISSRNILEYWKSFFNTYDYTFKAERRKKCCICLFSNQWAYAAYSSAFVTETPTFDVSRKMCRDLKVLGISVCWRTNGFVALTAASTIHASLQMLTIATIVPFVFTTALGEVKHFPQMTFSAKFCEF